MKHSRTQSCQIQHFIVSDLLKLAGIRNLTRVSGINTVHIGIDLTGICMKRCRKSYGCGIRTATSKCGIVIIFINALEACDHNDPAVIQLSADTCRIDLFQACATVCTCCVHSHLKGVQGNSRYSQTVHSHGHQCH